MMNSIVEEIRRNSSFLITTHEGPDGDAVGSSLALANYLTSAGKRVTVYMADPVPDLYTFLPLADQVVNRIPDADFDVAFVLDIGEFRRAGKEFTSFKRIGKLINIDHHLACENFGDLNLIDSKAAATGCLVYRILRTAAAAIDYNTAVCLYTAVITDTGSFHYSNANREAFTVAGEMIDAGVDAWAVSEQLYESQPRKRLELLAAALGTLQISPHGDYASVTVTLEMYERTGGSAELTDGFVNYPRSIRGVEVAILFREVKPGLFKVGFRSKGKVNVALLAAHFGGGGHHNAAGATVEGSYEKVKETVFAYLEEALTH